MRAMSYPIKEGLLGRRLSCGTSESLSKRVGSLSSAERNDECGANSASRGSFPGHGCLGVNATFCFSPH